MKRGLATVAQLSEFDEIIDARSPAEFAEDSIPGAVSCPVLDDAQRVIVGTVYKQRSAFEARRMGAAMVATNIARHLAERFHDRPRHWRPLVYCWRGGQRSGAFVTWLRLVGWDACQLEGGYKQWRRQVVDQLAAVVARLRFCVLCGPTGSAKTRVLTALGQLGAQTLDLEAIAAHRGSVLGALSDRSQPSQKRFETELYARLVRMNPAHPVFVEAESRKIGRLHVPEALIMQIRAGDCVVIEATRDARLGFLVRDYADLGADSAELCARLAHLRKLHSRDTLERWQAHAQAGRLAALYGELIDQHYDPLYRRSQNRNFSRIAQARHYRADALDEAGIARLAAAMLTDTPPTGP